MMPALPLVSVITPSFNQGAFIAATIESVLGQDYAPLEYWVIDGGSTDKTLEVMRRYGNRLRWVSEPDGGQAMAINKGWRRAQGEIIAWLNSDDTYCAGAVHRAVEALERDPELEAVYGQADYVDVHGNVIRPYPTRPYDYVELVRSTLNFIPQPAVFLRRRVLDSVGYLDETLSYVMDFDYWLRLGVRHEMGYVPQKLAHLRLHEAAKTVRQAGEFAPELIRVYQRLFARTDLPEAVQAARTQAMRNAYYNAATFAFWSAHLPAARQYALQGWLLDPMHFRRLWLVLLLGRMGLKIAERWLRNPFYVDVRPA